jgi:hypothetical protein
MIRKCFSLLVGVVFLAVAGAAHATNYTQDSNIGDFTAGVTNYATFTNFTSGETPASFTPTSAEIASTGLSVYYGGALTGLPSYNNWILASFAGAESQIRVFPNIDHYGSDYDGYQYSIEGSNDLSTWTPLFDVLSVNGSGEPFTLGSYSGTAPYSVNNVLTPGGGSYNGVVGYEADFSFGQSYKYYAFGASDFALGRQPDQELSAVGALVPEPSALVLLATGLVGVFGFGWRRRNATRDFA